MPPKFPISQIVEGLRKFDGTTPVQTWISKLESDLTEASLDAKWVLRNLDRLLIGGVKSWWTSNEAAFTEGLDSTNADAKWTDVIKALKNHFGGESLKQQAKLKNSQIKFSYGDDPQDYVMRKLEIFTSMNPAMTNQRKIDHLIDGLPRELALQMLCSLDRDVITPMQFLNRLRSCGNYLNRLAKPATHSGARVRSDYGQNPGLGYDKRESSSLFSSVVNNNGNSSKNNNAMKRDNRDSIRPGQCKYCRRFGHYEKECYRKADDEGRPRPQPKAGRNRPHQQSSQGNEANARTIQLEKEAENSLN